MFLKTTHDYSYYEKSNNHVVEKNIFEVMPKKGVYVPSLISRLGRVSFEANLFIKKNTSYLCQIHFLTIAFLS
jgi:hypothetical protein